MKKKKILIIVAAVCVAVAVITAGVIYALSNCFNAVDIGIIGGADGPTSIIVNNKSNEAYEFSATVIEAKGDMLLVKPADDSAEIKSSDKIYVAKPENVSFTPQKGDSITIIYDGMIQETYPAQINVVYDIIEN